jgi:hypothetical protein
MIRVIGIDVPQGWAVVDVPLIGQTQGVAFGELEKGREVARFAELVAKYKPARVGIETPMEAYVHGRGAKGNEGQRRSVVSSLIDCARLAGRIEDRALTCASIVAVVVDADEVRRRLGIHGQTTTDRDRGVKMYVLGNVRGWPERSNADERDAACVAIYAARKPRKDAGQ